MSGSYLLSHRGCPLSTIGVGRLNFRVRDGNGWDPSAITTGLYSIVKLKVLTFTLKIA